LFKIDYSVEPFPSGWGEWQKADYIMTDRMDKFTLIHGGEPKSKTQDMPRNMPALRFKLLKE
jgi:hypothetical protein